MAPRMKRGGANGSSKQAASVSTNSPVNGVVNGDGATPGTSVNAAPLAATEEEKQNWQGWCEIESDPAYFNVMLREFGVTGVKVREVFGLDEGSLTLLPKPVYGLIFLFRYRETDGVKRSESCPEHVWFANQTIGNACATVALLNIVNNVPGLDIGEHLRSFKEFTRDFSPALRGDSIDKFEFVKRIHNSFARKLDMLNVDLDLKKRYASRKRRKPKNSKNSKRARKNTTADDAPAVDDEDAAYHFIAFMPIRDDVWKLDGLDRQPLKLGKSEGDKWLELIAPDVAARMAAYETEQIQFSLLSLSKDPMLEHCHKLVENIKSLQAVESRLASLKADWKDFATDLADSDLVAATVRGPDLVFGITSAQLDEAAVPESVQRKLSIDDDTTTLLDLRQSIITQQAVLRAAIREEGEAWRLDQEKAARKRFDYGPMIRQWLAMLAENGTLRTLVEEAATTGCYGSN